MHLTTSTWMVEDAEKVLVGMNWNCDKQTNLMTHRKWPTPLLNRPTNFPSLFRYFIWKVKKVLDPTN
jgi:hypothetical protein